MRDAVLDKKRDLVAARVALCLAAFAQSSRLQSM